MTVDISVDVNMCQEDIIETLVSFARNGNGIAYQNLYRQFFKDVEVSEVDRTFNLIRRAFDMSKKCK